MQKILETVTPLSSIVNRRSEFNNNSQLTIDNSKRVDLLFEDVQDLVDPSYRLWFIKRFLKMSSDSVRRLAASTREQVIFKPETDAKRLFSWLIKKEVGY